MAATVAVARLVADRASEFNAWMPLADDRILDKISNQCYIGQRRR